MRHTLNWKILRKEHLRRQIIVGVLAFVGVVVWRIHTGEPLTLKILGIAAAGAVMLGWGSFPWQWMPQVAEDQEWEIEPVQGGLRFHFRGSGRTISGSEIRSLKVRKRDGDVQAIDVTFGEQTTRIENYQDMATLYAHILSIVPAGIRIDEC